MYKSTASKLQEGPFLVMRNSLRRTQLSYSIYAISEGNIGV